MTDKMRLTNAELWTASTAGGEVAAALVRLKDQPMRARAARAMQTLLRQAAAAFADLDAARQTVCKQHAVMEVNDGTAKPKLVNGAFVIDDQAAFDREIQDLFSEEIMLDARPIRDDELDVTATLTPNDIERLGPFLVATA